MITTHDVRVDFTYHQISYPDIVVQPHTVTFVVGNNGVGKTTLLRSIANLQTYSGTVTTSGLITYVAQTPYIFHTTVLKNILYPFYVQKKTIPMDRINHYVALFGLDHCLEQTATTLSAGEKQKVALLRAILFEPDVVLLDEPTSHLDLQSIEQLKQLITEFKQTITFLIVSHNLDFIQSTGDQTIPLGGKDNVSSKDIR